MWVFITFLIGVILAVIFFSALFYLPLFLYVNHVNNKKNVKLGERTIKWSYVIMVIIGVPAAIQVLKLMYIYVSN